MCSFFCSELLVFMYKKHTCHVTEKPQQRNSMMFKQILKGFHMNFKGLWIQSSVNCIKNAVWVSNVYIFFIMFICVTAHSLSLCCQLRDRSWSLGMPTYFSFCCAELSHQFSEWSKGEKNAYGNSVLKLFWASNDKIWSGEFDSVFTHEKVIWLKIGTSTF